jgi:hypothetical protein
MLSGVRSATTGSCSVSDCVLPKIIIAGSNQVEPDDDNLLPGDDNLAMTVCGPAMTSLR